MTSTRAPGVTDHRGLRVLDFDECLERLRQAPIGRLAFVTAGESVIFPVNHGVDGDTVVFRTMHGAKLDHAASSGNVAYEVDGYDTGTETGWSVVVKGSAQIVYDQDDVARYDALGLRSWGDQDRLGLWVRIRAVEVSGRELAG